MRLFLQSKSPHIVAGMHFDIHRFRELYDWIQKLQMDSIAVASMPYHFGLLHYNNPETDFILEIIGNKLYLRQCCGITKNGSIIGIFEDEIPPLIYDLSELNKDDIYEILVTVDNCQRFPIGTPDAQEIPLREPFSIPKYHFDIFNKGAKDINKFPNALKIGQIQKTQLNFELLEYIPVSAHVGACSLLWRKFLEYKKKINDFYTTLKDLGQKTDVEFDKDLTNLRSIVLSMGLGIANERDIFDLDENVSTFQLFSFFKKLANNLDFQYQVIHRRSELIGLINKHVSSYLGRSFTPQSFRDAIDGLVNSSYNHLDIAENLQAIDIFLDVIYLSAFDLLNNNNRILSLEHDVQKNPTYNANKKRNFF